MNKFERIVLLGSVRPHKIYGPNAVVGLSKKSNRTETESKPVKTKPYNTEKPNCLK